MGRRWRKRRLSDGPPDFLNHQKEVVMKYLISCLAGLFLSLGLAGQPVNGLESLGEQHARKNRHQALMAAVVEAGQARYHAFGTLSRALPMAPNEETIFEIGALTGLFTANLMTKSVLEGVIGYGDPILAYLPAQVEAPIFQPQKCLEVILPVAIEGMPQRVVSCSPDPSEPEVCMAFCDLATHTSGLPNAGFGLYDWHPIGTVRRLEGPRPGFDREAFFQRLAQYPLNTAPGTTFRFSNIGIAAIGHLLGEVKGQPFEAILQEELLIPLGMTDTRMSVGAEQLHRRAPGHDSRGRPTTYWDFDGMAPAAGLKSTAKDLAAFLSANLDNTSPQWADIAEQAQQARIDVSFPGLQRPTQAGYGWLVSVLSPESNQSVAWMYGGTEGFRAFIGLIKDHGLGIALLSNSAVDIRELGFEMLEALYLESVPGSAPKEP
jgi:CubicO group peptidase (beta-lactamase class C family)